MQCVNDRRFGNPGGAQGLYIGDADLIGMKRDLLQERERCRDLRPQPDVAPMVELLRCDGGIERQRGDADVDAHAERAAVQAGDECSISPADQSDWPRIAERMKRSNARPKKLGR